MCLRSRFLTTAVSSGSNITAIRGHVTLHSKVVGRCVIRSVLYSSASVFTSSLDGNMHKEIARKPLHGLQRSETLIKKWKHETRRLYMLYSLKTVVVGGTKWRIRWYGTNVLVLFTDVNSGVR
jgi:hypothetical protein